MKSRFKVLSLVSIVLLMFGVSSTVLADNAAQVSVEVSYPCAQGDDPCDTDEAVTRSTGGDVVNIYVTLLDASGDPATAGPLGGALSGVTATLSTGLGIALSLTPGQFATDAVGLTFDTPSGSGPAARAQVIYTGATPGVDQIIVTVPDDPDPIVGNAEVNVVAPPAVSLQVRTPRNLPPPTTIFTTIPPQLFNNGAATEVVGTAVPFYVIADDGLGKYTYAPELDGQQVTVMAYAEYSMNGNPVGLDAGSDGVIHEMMPIATQTATFTNGVAQGTIIINNGVPSAIIASGLYVNLTAEVDSISSVLMTGAGIASGAGWVPGVSTANPSTDYIPMLASPSFVKVIIGIDLYGNATLIDPISCLNVLAMRR